ncbi:hypothetical protein [Nocardia nova]|uniref:hypothetical protein n=1 Tax=Nocardia nova TaxID=37330 RepID=UPI00273A4BCE|nr:hypothetical protein [Nocardia nova]
MSSNEPRDQLAALVADQGIDLRRDIPIGGWPDDEAALYTEMAPEKHTPARVNWLGQEARRAAIQRLRCEKLADSLLSEGWRPPHRRIETAAALSDEPDGTVLRFRGGVVAAVNTANGHWPGRVRTLESPVDHWHLSDGDTDLFPAVVLWEPKEAAGE